MTNLFEKINREFQLWLLEKDQEMKVVFKDHNWQSADFLLYRLKQVANDPRYVLNDIVRKAVEKKIDIIKPPVEEPKRKPGRPFSKPQDENIVIASSSSADEQQARHDLMKKTFG